MDYILEIHLKKEIYLTFDEGYENGYTPKILDVLKENKVKAVFFITGPYLSQHQNLVRRMVEEGHTVGNHTVHHPSLLLQDEKVEEEVLGLERAFKEKLVKACAFYVLLKANIVKGHWQSLINSDMKTCFGVLLMMIGIEIKKERIMQ